MAVLFSSSAAQVPGSKMCTATCASRSHFLCLASVGSTLAEVWCGAELSLTRALGSLPASLHFLPLSSTIMLFTECSFQNCMRHTLFTSSIHSTHLLLTHSANYNCVFITVKCQVLNEELGMLLEKVSRGSVRGGRAGRGTVWASKQCLLGVVNIGRLGILA